MRNRIEKTTIFLLYTIMFSFPVFHGCKVIDTSGSPFQVDTLKTDKAVLATGEMARINCSVKSISGTGTPDSVSLTCTRGYFLDLSDTSSLGSDISLAVDSGGSSVQTVLVNPFTVEEETVWVEAGIQSNYKRIPIIFIAGDYSGVEQPCALSLSNVDYNTIGVKGSGGNEVSTITFSVTGSMGMPVDDGIEVDFTASGPGGAPSDTLLIASAGTAGGTVTTAVRSGSKSGTMLISAQIRGTSIMSTAVPIVIEGGLPHAGYQSIGSDALNIPGAAVIGSGAQIKVFFYDRYHNPVRTGTAVYFTANTGGITGSAFLNAAGTATVSFVSGSAVPDNRMALIIASTYDDSSKILADSCQVLLSGPTNIHVFKSDSTVLPDTLQIPNGGLTTLLVMICDDAGYPLSSGTTIQVTASAGTVIGQSSVTLEDTIDKEKTKYAVQWADDDPTTTEQQTGYLNISVSSRNGNQTAGLWAVLY